MGCAHHTVHRYNCTPTPINLMDSHCQSSGDVELKPLCFVASVAVFVNVSSYSPALKATALSLLRKCERRKWIRWQVAVMVLT